MKRTTTEKEIYAERRYIAYRYSHKYIKAFYNYILWKHYEKKCMKEFLTK